MPAGSGVRDGELVIRRCSFSGNSAVERGGAVYAYAASRSGGGLVPIVIEGCSFSGNAAEIGGAVYASYSQPAGMTGCRFIGNVAEKGGGAV